MRRYPLVVPAAAALLLLLAALPLFASAAEPKTVPESKALLAERGQTLAKAVEGLAVLPVAPNLKERTAALLSALPAELDKHTLLALAQGQPDDAAAAKASVLTAASLQTAFWAKPAAGHPFVVELKRAADALALMSAATRSAGAGQTGAEPDPAALAAAGNGVTGGRRVLTCAGSFDGGSCVAGADADRSAASRSQAPGRRIERGDGRAANGQEAAAGSAPRRAEAGAGRATPAETKPSTANSPLSGGLVNLDRGVVPPPATVSGSGGAAAAGGLPSAVPPLSAESRSCVVAVNGDDPGKPEHPTIAGMCANHPTIAPLLAGLLDAVKEQFGTVSGILMNLLFLILGLLMAVATGGVALILKLLALIGASFAIFMLIRSLISAAGTYSSAKKGSPEKAAALRSMGLIGGNIMIMITMALVGFGIGKTKPGAAAVRSMEGGMSGALNKIGGTAMMESLNSRIPAPMVAALEKVFGKAPAKPGTAPKPAAKPRELLPEIIENPRVAAVAGKAGLVSRVTAAIKSDVRSQVAVDMDLILRGALGAKPGDGKITGAQFNVLLRRLTAYAESVEGGGISLAQRWGLKGVYPKGPNRIDYKGFGLIADEARAVSGAELHELTHLFHTVQMRSTVLASGVSKREATKFLAFMEDGVNYMNLEYYATTVGKPIAGGTGAARFNGIVTSLIKSVENAMNSGKVELPLGVPIEKGYAYWATRIVPALLGKSPAELVLVRMPIGTFVGYYAANTDISFVLEGAAIDAKKLQALGVPAGQRGLRDVLNGAIVAQMTGEPGAPAAQVADK